VLFEETMTKETTLKHNPALLALQRSLFLWAFPFTFLMFGLPIYSKALGANALAIGGMFSTFIVATLLVRPVVGWVVDRWGRKGVFVTALLVYAAAMAVYAFAASIAGFYLANAIQGTGSALLWISANTVIADTVAPGQRGRALGSLDQNMSRGGLVGVFAGFIFMSFLPETTAWPLVFSIYTLTTLAAALLAWRRLPETRPSFGTTAAPRWTVSPAFGRLLVVVFVTGASEAMLAPVYLIFLQDRFTTEIEVLAWAFFPAGLVFALLGARLGGLSDRFGRVPTLAAGIAGSGLLSLLLPNLPSVLWLAVLYTLSAVAWAVSEPAETSLVAELSNQQQRGMGFGIYDFVNNLGMAAGPLLGGLLYDSYSQAAPFYLNGVILLLSAFWIITMLRKS
jgi:MFS family permease